METSQLLELLALLLFAFALNLPLGYLREGCRRYSFRWFLYIHLSIPGIVALRVLLGMGWRVVPFSIACAVAGQIAGGWIRRRRT